MSRSRQPDSANSDEDALDDAMEYHSDVNSFNNEDETDSGSDIDLEIDTRRKTQLGSLVKQARIARAELQRMEEETDEEEVEEEDKEQLLRWGRRNQYYGTNALEKEGEDEKEELQEAIKLQRTDLQQLDDADFDTPSLAVNQPQQQSSLQIVAGEKNDQKTLLALYGDLKDCLNETKTKIRPLLDEARKGDVCTTEGLSYLEAKHLLLLHYSMCIIFYLLLKIEGKSVRDHPVLLRLVEIRAYLEKLKPIESRLQPQVEKLLRAVSLAKDEADEEEDEEALVAHPEQLISKVSADDDVYHPPKLHPVALEDERPEKSRGKARRNAAEETMVTEIVEEMTGAPEERSSGVTPIERVQAILANRHESDRAQYEEQNYVRIASGKQLKTPSAKRAGQKFGGIPLHQLTDDIEERLEAIQSTTPLSVRVPTKTIPSGDADVAPKERKRYPKPDVLPEQMQIDKPDEEKKVIKKAAKVKRSYPPKPDKTVTGLRGISSLIEKNRGLTPYRAREKKNPRRRHRLQFENKKKRLSSQVQQGSGQAPDHYSGEATGISKRVKKSVKFA